MPVSRTSIAVAKELLPSLVPFSDHCLHDCWIYLLAAAMGRVAFIPEPLTLYRTDTEQTMGGEKKSLARLLEARIEFVTRRSRNRSAAC